MAQERVVHARSARIVREGVPDDHDLRGERDRNAVDIVPERYKIIFDLNPISLFINAYRRVVLQDISPGWDRLLLGLAISLATFIIGYYLFKRLERGFADHI